MAYTGITKSAFEEMLTALVVGKDFKIAFYTEAQDAATAAIYTTANEFSGTGYTAGGVPIALAATPIVVNTEGVFIHFSNISLPNITTGSTPIKGYAIYDVTDDGVNPVSNKVVVAGKFTTPLASTNGTIQTNITYQMAGVKI